MIEYIEEVLEALKKQLTEKYNDGEELYHEIYQDLKNSMIESLTEEDIMMEIGAYSSQVTPSFFSETRILPQVEEMLKMKKERRD